MLLPPSAETCRSRFHPRAVQTESVQKRLKTAPYKNANSPFSRKVRIFLCLAFFADTGKGSAGVALSDKLLRLSADPSPASSRPEGLAGTNRKCPQREGLRHWTETHGGISPPLPPAAASGNLCHGITGRDRFVTQMSNKRCVSGRRAVKRPRELCPCAFKRRVR